MQNLAFLENLLSLYHRLLLMTDGNVDEALRALEEQVSSSASSTRVLDRGLRSRLKDGRHRGGQEDHRRRRADDPEGLPRPDLLLARKGLRGGTASRARAPRARGSETRPYEFGDAVSDIDFLSSVRNSMRRRRGSGSRRGLRLTEDDLEVYETEHLSSCATVLLIDVSHSMILYGEDRITPAKQAAARAGRGLITTHTPRIRSRWCSSGTTWEVKLRDIPYVSVGRTTRTPRRGSSSAQQILSRRST